MLGVTVWPISFKNHVIIIIRRGRESEMDGDNMKECTGEAEFSAILTQRFCLKFWSMEAPPMKGKLPSCKKKQITSVIMQMNCGCLWTQERIRSDEGSREPSRGMKTPLVEWKRKDSVRTQYELLFTHIGENERFCNNRIFKINIGLVFRNCT